MLATVGLLVGASGIAHADDISNHLDASIDAVAEVMPLNVGGPSGSTTLYVQPTNGDGKNGCNLTGSTTLVIALESSNPAVASVSPPSVTFTSCGTTPVVTVTPNSQGTATITAKETSNNTGATFNLAPVAFTVQVVPVTPANTAPTIRISGVEAGASYAKGSAPRATCEVTDAEDGNSSFDAALSAITGPYASDGIGDRTATCSYTDAGGLTATDSLTYSIIDPTTPAISYVVNPATPDGDNGWYKSDVTLKWTVSDPESPNSLATTGCADQDIMTDQSATDYTCSANSAGGSAGPVTITVKRDATAPNISCASPPTEWQADNVTVDCTADDGLSGMVTGDEAFSLSTTVPDGIETNAAETGSKTVRDLAGNSSTQPPFTGLKVDRKAPAYTCGTSDAVWHATDVNIPCSAADGGSGLVTPSAFSLSTNVPANTEDSNASTGTAPVTDAVGHTVTAGPVGGNKIDKRAPSIVVTTPADGATYTLNQAVAANYGCDDHGSGVKTCDGSVPSGTNIATDSVGAHTFTVNASDNVGNHSSATTTYKVAYAAGGTCLGSAGHAILQPVNPDGTSIFKAGSTVPVKFRVCDANGASIGTPGVVASFKLTAKSTEPAGASVNEDVVSTTPDQAFRWDPTAQQWIFNISTKGFTPGAKYAYTITLNDGSTIPFSFGVK